MATQRVKHKIGDTFEAAGRLREANGGPGVNLTAQGFIVTSAFRDSNNRLFPATVTLGDQAVDPGKFYVKAQSSTWPVDDEMSWDVQFKRGEIIHSTSTVTVITVADVTPN